jgi:hypothetical protein
MVSEEGLRNNIQNILTTAKENNVTLRLIGSTAIRAHSNTAQVTPGAVGDIDLAAYSSQTTQIENLFHKLGYSADEDFNMFHGAERLIFYGRDGLKIEVFLDELAMSHKINLRDRLHLDYPTISLTDLLMTKLQIVELNEKDIRDMISLLNDHEFAESDTPEAINSKYITDLCARDWGLYKTFTMNLQKILAHLEQLSSDEQARLRVARQCKYLVDRLESSPKSAKWKLRAKVGEKKRWYELPQES